MISRYYLLLVAVVSSTFSLSALTRKPCCSDFLPWCKNSLRIVGGMITHPCTTSALTESSPYVAAYMAKHVRLGNILEIGSGPGWALTNWIVDYVRKGGSEIKRFDIVECHDEFFGNLEKKYSNVGCVYLSKNYFNKTWVAQGVGDKDVCGMYDTIIATLPFTRLPDEDMCNILDRVLELLKPGGKFMYISLMGARTKAQLEAVLWESWDISVEESPIEICKKKLAILDDWLEKYFTVESRVVWRNIPPLWVGVATKK